MPSTEKKKSGGSGDEEKKNLLIQNHISLEVTNER
jgi:hypothetical protein